MLILPVDEAVCKNFARERGRLRKQGNIIGDFSYLITGYSSYGLNPCDIWLFAVEPGLHGIREDGA